VGKHTINQDQTTAWAINDSGDEWVLNKSASITVHAATAIYSAGSQHDNRIVVEGDVTVDNPLKIQAYSAISIYGADNIVEIGSDSIITSDSGISMSGDHDRLVNKGHVKSTAEGVYIPGVHATVINSGTIEGSIGIFLDGEASKIVNDATGKLISTGRAIYATSDANFFIDNAGLIKGGLGAIQTGDGETQLTNTGTIKGDVILGGGDDVFDTRGGNFAGTVDGGAGNDTFVTDNAALKIAESLFGGDDTVRSTVSYTLSGYLENLSLLGNKDIDAKGSDWANLIRGNSGDNELRGLGGADTLNGGKGEDRLVGGIGTDTFVFKTGDGHDVITDFNPLEDSINLKGMDAITSFSDLKHHHLEVAGDDLRIVAGGDEILLKHIDKGDLTAAMFDF
jgi:Ca2+-binding RTX toxin-like protein